MPRVQRPLLLVSVLLLPVLSACQEADRPQLVASAHAQAKPAALAAFRYVTRLAPLDHVNSKGVVLADAAAVLRQDRARVHAGRGDAEDQKDPALASDASRDAFEKLARASLQDPALNEAILRRNPKVQVEGTADRIQVTVLDKGSDEVACLLTDGRLNDVAWDSAADSISLATHWQSRGWKTAKTPASVQVLRPDGQLAATFLRESDGPDALRLEGSTCTTPYGVRVGATLAEAKLDPQIKQATCNCQDGNNVILWASNQAFTYQYRIDATCKKPVKCMASDTDIMCPTAMGRKDCTITSILVQPAAG